MSGERFGRRGFVGLLVVLALTAALSCAVGASSAGAAVSPWWHLGSGQRPSALEVEGRGQIVVTVANFGDAAANGGSVPVSVTDTLPEGVKVVACSGSQKPGCGVEGVAGEPEGLEGNRGKVECPAKGPFGQTVTCTFGGSYERGGKVLPKTLPPFDQIEITIEVEVAGEGVAAKPENRVDVSGAGARTASLARELHIGGQSKFGVENYELTPEEEGGAPTTQAGAHPFQVTGTVTLDQNEIPEAVALPKELNGQLPPGLIGNPTPLPQCTLGQFLTITGFLSNKCPEESVVGVAMVTINERTNLGLTTFSVPIFNLEPSVGEPARFGFYAPGAPVVLDPSVRTGGDYGITLGSDNITQTAALLEIKTTFWGVPGDPRHDPQRGIGCLEAAREEISEVPCAPLEVKNPPPFLSMPTSCTGPLQTSIEAASWAEPKRKLIFPGQPMQAMDGCNRLSFDPSIRLTPDGHDGSTPTGLGVDVHVPQDSVLVANGLAESNVKGIAVTLPEGVALNPSGADGLEACSEGQVGFTGADSGGVDHFTPTLAEPFCPDGSKIGTATIHTPLLPRPLTGAVYLAAQSQNPFGSLVAMYLEVEDPVSGTIVKLAGEVKLSASGQITGTFANNPQLAFEDAEIHFFGGARAPLATPAHCGSYTTTASFEPWSGNQSVASSDSFSIDSGPNGSPCPGTALPFGPSLTGGSTNIQAGGFTPFTTTMTRPDGQQDIHSVTLHMPPGLSGILVGVPLCGEADANNGTCPAGSLIGETIVSVGVGTDPFSVKGGKVYITGPYKGAPFGLSIVNPAKAGPFDLGQVVVRAKLEVDPITAGLTVTTDGEGPYAIPSILDGIPLQIQHVNVTITRPGFTFNPTNCSPKAITGAIASNAGASGPVSVPFQVTNCALLGFKPQFKVSTSGKTSRKLGALLKVNLAYPKAAFGSQANIRSVKVSLPRQLPSNLKAIQNACPHQTFEANPGACSPNSRVGSAKATTPLLPVALEGPAYFVSYGGAKFPELVIVLQGYGVTLDLHGETFIDEHTNITSSTFHTVPDAPVGTFELTLPQGPFSALSAPSGVCNITTTKLVKKRVKVHGKTVTRKVKTRVAAGLTMPTLFVAQNGAQLKQSTPIAVSGCPKAKHKAKKAGRASRNRHAGAKGHK